MQLASIVHSNKNKIYYKNLIKQQKIFKLHG